MAHVTLDTVWLTPLDPAVDPVDLRVVAIRDTRTRPGEVRRYIGGRMRAVTAGPRMQGVEITTGMVPQSKVDQLAPLAGEVVSYRDPDGRDMWCVFLELPADAFMGIGAVSFPLKLVQVTATDAV